MIQWIVFPWENPSEGVRVSSGHLCEAEAPTEAVAETRTVFARFKAFPLRGRWILHRLAMQKTDEVSPQNAATYP